MRTNTLALGLISLLAAACGGRIGAPSDEGVGTPASPSPSGPGQTAPVVPGESAASPETVATGIGAPSALALSADAVVFTTHDTVLGGELVEAGALFVSDKRVGPALMIAVDRQGAHYDALTVDAESAFVGTSDGRVLRVPLMGGADVEVADVGGPVVALRADGEHVYIARDSGEVSVVAKAGGPVTALGRASGVVRGLEADAEAVYVATVHAEGGGSSGIARIDRATHDVSIVAGTDEACALTQANGHLYWTNLVASSPEGIRGEVKSLTLDGLAVTTVASGSFDACAIASDTESLWFSTTALGALSVRSGGEDTASPVGVGLMRAPVGGGVPVAVSEAASALVKPGAVAVDESHLYWLTATGVLRLRK